MKNLTRFLCFFLLALTSVKAEEKAPPLTVAIFDFQAGPWFKGNGPEMTALLNAKLSTVPQVVLVERAELSKLLSEQGLGAAGLADPATAARIGQLAGAKVLITGRLIELDGKTVLVAKIMSVETSRVFGESVTMTEPGTLEAALTELAQRIEKVLTQQAGVLVAKGDTRPARLARLKEMLQHKKLPTVQIQIQERHLSAAAPDPAAEMEFKTVLQQLGFTLVDPQQANAAPEILIRGEGFSEFAGRRETLISCRARLEVEAVRKADGKILQADRETSVAVDVAEQIAGKTALQEAAFTLLERMIPKLADAAP